MAICPLPEPVVIREQLHIGIAKYLLNRNDKTSNRHFLNTWEKGRKATETQKRISPRGLASRQLIEHHMKLVFNAQKAELMRQATRL